MLETNPKLTDLKLRGTKQLCEWLKINTSLTTLILGGECLKINTSLTTLDLEYNKIGDKGTKQLRECLKINTSLTILKLAGTLWGHGVSDTQQIEIGKYLDQNKRLIEKKKKDREWKWSEHGTYSKQFRDIVKTLFMMRLKDKNNSPRHRECYFSTLPIEVMFIIIQLIFQTFLD